MIKTVIKFDNGMVMVFNGRGNQIAKYQGKYADVREKVLAAAPGTASFYYASTLHHQREYVSRDNW